MAGADPGAHRRAPSWDRFLTIALLVLGVWNVTLTVAQARDLPTFFTAFYAAQGIDGTYTSLDVAATAGWIVIAANVACMVLAIGFAVPRLRTHRLAFWIPLACGAISVLVSTVVIVGAMVPDPAFMGYLQKQGA